MEIERNGVAGKGAGVMGARIFTVVPTFNRIQFTISCLEQLQVQACSIPQTVILVDDGSSDGTVEMIRSRFPEIVLIEGQGDWYWTGSVYQGVERALELSESDEDFVFILNDDLDFDSDLLQKLTGFLEINTHSIVQALGSWVDRRNDIQFAGVSYNGWTAKRKENLIDRQINSFDKGYAVESDSLTGRGVFFPIRVFKDVGNYDRRIIHRGDPEMTHRALKAGWKLFVYFDAVVYNHPVEGKGNINERKTYCLGDVREYFWGVLSSSHIPTLWRNSRTYTRSWLQWGVCFSFMLARHTWNFMKRFRLK